MSDSTANPGVQNDLTAGSAPDPFFTPLRNALAPEPGYTYGNLLPVRSIHNPDGTITNQGPGIPTQFRDLGNGILDLLQGTRTGEMTPEATMALATLGAGSGVHAGAVGDSATARIFGGLGAKTADKSAFSKATSMPAGADTFAGTGWFKDVDGRWKFEIPDQGVKLRGAEDATEPDTLVGITGQDTTLGDVLDHPELFDAYPQLAKTKVLPLGDEMTNQGILGIAHDDGSISLAPGHPDDLKSTLLHEVQHQVQNSEGFASGGSPMEFLPAGHAEALGGAITRLNDLHERLARIPDPTTGGTLNPMNLQSAVLSSKSGNYLSTAEQATLNAALQKGLLSPYIKALDYYQLLQGMSAKAMAKYKSFGGEVESRNVQARTELSDPSAVHPHDTPGYHQGPQIIRYYTRDGGTAVPVDNNPFSQE